MDCGVYEIRNVINDKVYIGSSINIKNRKYQHFYELCKNKHKNPKLQNAVNKYGKENFKFEILAKCPSEYRLKLEQWFIDSLTPFYNIKNNAKGGSNLKLKDSEILDILKTYAADTRSKQKLLSYYNIGNGIFEKIVLRKHYNHVVIENELNNKLLELKGRYSDVRKCRKLNDLQVQEIRWLFLNNYCITDISAVYKVKNATIRYITKGMTYKVINGNIKPSEKILQKIRGANPLYKKNISILDRDGNTLKFDSIKNMSEKLDIPTYSAYSYAKSGKLPCTKEEASILLALNNKAKYGKKVLRTNLDTKEEIVFNSIRESVIDGNKRSPIRRALESGKPYKNNIYKFITYVL